MSDVYYKILPVEGIFLGLNARAVEYLILFGEWVTTQSLFISMPEGHEFGMLFVGEKEDGEDFVIAGSVWGDKIIPTITYDYLAIPGDKTGKQVPLYKYKMADYDILLEGEKEKNIWSHEIRDKKSSLLYKTMNLLCLTTDFEVAMYEWTSKEIELSEVLMEYDEGKF